jgi:coenzyme F420-reducing hydrogenase alpha subunit
MANIAIKDSEGKHSNIYIGELTIELAVNQLGTVQRVNIINSRPQNMGELLIGKSPEEALKTIPRLFMLCSQAQQVASFSAFNGLKSRINTKEQDGELARRCALEWLKEHSWQLWQMERELFGEHFAIQESIALSQFLIKRINQIQTSSELTVNQVLSDEIETHQANDQLSIRELLATLFGCSSSQFSRFNWQELMHWSLSEAPYAQLFAALKQAKVAQFGSFSEWDIAREEGPLARQAHHPLVASAIELWGASIATRTLARLVEMVKVNEDPGITLRSKQGTALASRGPLTHKVVLDHDGVIQQYVIDAPTDRYFSSHGLVSKALLAQTLPFAEPEENNKWLRQFIWSVDPCMEFCVKTIHHSRSLKAEATDPINQEGS